MKSFIKSALLTTAIVLSTTATFAVDNIIVINSIVVPEGKEAKALEIWDSYAEYFRKQPGYIDTKLHKSLDPKAKFHFINVATWKSADDFMKALNSDEIKKIGEGFPQDMPHYPSMYQIIRN